MVLFHTVHHSVNIIEFLCHLYFTWNHTNGFVSKIPWKTTQCGNSNNFLSLLVQLRRGAAGGGGHTKAGKQAPTPPKRTRWVGSGLIPGAKNEPCYSTTMPALPAHANVNVWSGLDVVILMRFSLPMLHHAFCALPNARLLSFVLALNIQTLFYLSSQLSDFLFHYLLISFRHEDIDFFCYPTLFNYLPS